MAGAILRHQLDFALKAPLLDGGLRAQLVTLGEDFRHGQRHEHFEAALRQAHGPPPEGRQDQKGEESTNQEPQREYHGLFDQGDNRTFNLLTMTRLSLKIKTRSCHGPASATAAALSMTGPQKGFHVELGVNFK